MIMQSIRIRLRLLVGGLARRLGLRARQPADRLPKLAIDPARVMVAGLSAGAYMATQSHLAWPEIFSGAALVAGGPYGCAAGDLQRALSSGMQGEPAIDVAALVHTARQRSSQGQLGDLTALAGQHVYVLHGRHDKLVAASVSRAAAQLYEALRAQIPGLGSLDVTWDGERDFGHGLPLAAQGDGSAESNAAFLIRCGFDGAGAIFQHLYGEPPRRAETATGELRPFDQSALNGQHTDALLAETGYLYLPRSCMDGARCGLLVVFHGCLQNVSAVGHAFVRDSGFNRWADVYNVAVLYPQTRATVKPLNPNACWDWWGYSGANYDTRQGVQQQWLSHALAALGVPKLVR